MKALKALVVVMGILIVAGIGLVIYGLLTQFGDGPEAPVATAPGVAPPVGEEVRAVGGREALGVLPPAPFGDVLVEQPPGTEIVGATVGEGRILLRLSGGGKPDRVVVLKAGDGAMLGTIGLATQQDDVAQPVGGAAQ